MYDGCILCNDVASRLVKRRIIFGYDWNQANVSLLSDDSENDSNITTESDWSDNEDLFSSKSKEGQQRTNIQKTNVPITKDTYQIPCQLKYSLSFRLHRISRQ